MRLGLDYVGFSLSAAAHRSAGSSFACRYLRDLSRSEVHALQAGGVDIVSIHETSATRALGGYSAGVADAATARRQALACGLPGGRPIYFAIDFDVTPAQQGTVNQYFRGVRDILDNSGAAGFPTPIPAGAYGGYWPIKRLFDAGLIAYGWQTYAWSGGQIDKRAQLYQFSNNHSVAGVGVDYDHAMHDDFGQWALKSSPTPPPAPPPPPQGEKIMSITAAANKDGLLEVFCEAQPAGTGKCGQVYHIKQDPSTRSQWWETPDGTPNWLSLGIPS